MKINIVTIIILGLASIASAQKALVVQLDPEDAARAKSLYEQKSQIDQQIKDMTIAFSEKYIWEPVPTTGKDLLWEPKKGWGSYFEFSTDFRFIVPSPADPSFTPRCTNLIPSLGFSSSDEGIKPPDGAYYGGGITLPTISLPYVLPKGDFLD